MYSVLYVKGGAVVGSAGLGCLAVGGEGSGCIFSREEFLLSDTFGKEGVHQSQKGERE